MLMQHNLPEHAEYTHTHTTIAPSFLEPCCNSEITRCSQKIQVSEYAYWRGARGCSRGSCRGSKGCLQSIHVLQNCLDPAGTCTDHIALDYSNTSNHNDSDDVITNSCNDNRQDGDGDGDGNSEDGNDDGGNRGDEDHTRC